MRAFSERGYKFLIEYCKITKPLTKALDLLQGEIKYTYVPVAMAFALDFLTVENVASCVNYVSGS